MTDPRAHQPPARRLDLLTVIAAAHPDPEAAQEAWQRLVRDLGGSRSAGDYLMGGHTRPLIPVLDSRADLLDPPAALREVLAAETARTWGANERLLLLTRPALDRLIHSGVRVAALGPLALLGDAYPLHRERRIRTLDILVDVTEHNTAVRILTAHGWTFGEHAARDAQQRSPWGGPTTLRDPSATVWIAVHTRPVAWEPLRRHPGTAEQLEQVALPDAHPLAGTGVQRPDPELTAVRIASAATAPRSAWQVRWMVDLHRVLTRSVGGCEPARLASEARQRGVGVQVAAALATLGVTLALPHQLDPASVRPEDPREVEAELVRMSARRRAAELRVEARRLAELRAARHGIVAMTEHGDVSTRLTLWAAALGEVSHRGRTARAGRI